MFTFSPVLNTWSNPLKPISYAQPSPPTIHIDFFSKNPATWLNSAAAGLLISFNLFFTSLTAKRCFIIAASSSSLFSKIASVNSVPTSSLIVFNKEIAYWRFMSVANFIPNPNSALSSNKELAQAGPFPAAFLLQGVVGRFPPNIEEQPVAFATSILSPNSCVNNFK